MTLTDSAGWTLVFLLAVLGSSGCLLGYYVLRVLQEIRRDVRLIVHTLRDIHQDLSNGTASLDEISRTVLYGHLRTLRSQAEAVQATLTGNGEEGPLNRG